MSSLPEDPAPAIAEPKRLWAPWWLAGVLGIVCGTALTLLRAHKSFVVPGAIALAVLILIVGIATVVRRQRHVEALDPPISAAYVAWMVLGVALAGPLQMFLQPSNPQGIAVKAIAVSLGLAVAIYGADRALFAKLAKPRRG